jgi:glycerophosphoryl diester phosphodiesterase
MAWLRGQRRWWWALGVLAVAVAVIIAWPYARQYAGAAPPVQFYRPVHLEHALSHDYKRVFGVAHNAGNNANTTKTALQYGAEAIEIDVISAHGQLVAGRDQPWPWLARRVFAGQTLSTAWTHAASAKTVKLDLKQFDRAFLDDLIAFVASRVHQHRLIISSTDEGSLLYLHGRVPGAILLFSMSGPDAVGRLTSDRPLQESIGGVSIAQGLVSPTLVTWLHRRRYLILAWTVNDSDAFNQMVRLHVDGITTANLAILDALGGSVP